MPSRPNRILAIVVGVVAVLAVVAAVLSATRREPQYDRGTPEGVVQAYASAVLDGDHEAAARFLSPQSPCTVDDFDRAYQPSDDVRVVLLDSRTDGAAAQVRVDVVTSSGPLDGSEYAEKHTFRVTRTGGDWLLTGEPWPLFGCDKEG